MQVAIVKAGGANFGSVLYALERLGVKAILTNEPNIIKESDRVILPGVGSAQAAMQRIAAKEGLKQALLELSQPTLAICLGMQTLCESSEEADTDCLGIIPLRVKKFKSSDQLRVPHMGWNQVTYCKDHPLYFDLPEHDYAYFVHSFYVPISEYSIATSYYGIEFSSGLQYKNYFAVQYHPERSAQHGATLLKNFVQLNAESMS